MNGQSLPAAEKVEMRVDPESPRPVESEKSRPEYFDDKTEKDGNADEDRLLEWDELRKCCQCRFEIRT